MYYFYILRCSDDSLYCGMTSNLENRLKEHNSSGPKGAKYLRGKKPVTMVYSEEYPSVGVAMSREAEVKKWSKAKKEALVAGNEVLKHAVVQKDEYGCGAACVAFVLGADYKEAASLMGKDKAENVGFYCREIVSVLAKRNLKYTYNYLKPRLRKKIYKDGVIVFIKRSKRYPAGHYLVRYEGLWMDPWINILQSESVADAKSGFRKKLSGIPIYAMFPM
jgi:putative endonuclease